MAGGHHQDKIVSLSYQGKCAFDIKKVLAYKGRLAEQQKEKYLLN